MGAIKEEKLNLQIEDLNLQLKVEKNKYEVLHKQKNETEETWKLNEEKRINEIKKKRKEVETKNEKLEKENGIMKHELVQLQAKLATLLKKQGQIEQKTKDDIAFQALHH